MSNSTFNEWTDPNTSNTIKPQVLDSILDKYIIVTTDNCIKKLKETNIPTKSKALQILRLFCNKLSLVKPEIIANVPPSPIELFIDENTLKMEWSFNYKTSEFLIDNEKTMWLFNKVADEEIISVVGKINSDNIENVIDRIIRLMLGVVNV